jgi:hypothetical protein
MPTPSQCTNGLLVIEEQALGFRGQERSSAFNHRDECTVPLAIDIVSNRDAEIESLKKCLAC